MATADAFGYGATPRGSVDGSTAPPATDEGAALLTAAQNGEVSAIEEWQRRGGNIDGAIVHTGAADSPNLTPLQMAAAVGDVTVAATLLRCGADPDAPDREQADLPSFFCVPLSAPPDRESRNSAGGDRRRRSSRGRHSHDHDDGDGNRQRATAGAAAAPRRSWGGGGYPPLTLACRGGHAPLVQLLLRYGADTRSADEFGQSALHYAAAFGHAVAAAALAVADPRACLQVDGGGHIPRVLAEKAGHSAAAAAVQRGEDLALAAMTQVPGADAAALPSNASSRSVEGSSEGSTSRRRPRSGVRAQLPPAAAPPPQLPPLPTAPRAATARAYWSARVLRLWLGRLGLARDVMPRMLEQGFDDVLFIARE